MALGVPAGSSTPADHPYPHAAIPATYSVPVWLNQAADTLAENSQDDIMIPADAQDDDFEEDDDDQGAAEEASRWMKKLYKAIFGSFTVLLMILAVGIVILVCCILNDVPWRLGGVMFGIFFALSFGTLLLRFFWIKLVLEPFLPEQRILNLVTWFLDPEYGTMLWTVIAFLLFNAGLQKDFSDNGVDIVGYHLSFAKDYGIINKSEYHTLRYTLIFLLLWAARDCLVKLIMFRLMLGFLMNFNNEVIQFLHRYSLIRRLNAAWLKLVPSSDTTLELLEQVTNHHRSSGAGVLLPTTDCSLDNPHLPTGGPAVAAGRQPLMTLASLNEENISRQERAKRQREYSKQRLKALATITRSQSKTQPGPPSRLGSRLNSKMMETGSYQSSNGSGSFREEGSILGGDHHHKGSINQEDMLPPENGGSKWNFDFTSGQKKRREREYHVEFTGRAMPKNLEVKNILATQRSRMANLATINWLRDQAVVVFVDGQRCELRSKAEARYYGQQLFETLLNFRQTLLDVEEEEKALLAEQPHLHPAAVPQQAIQNVTMEQNRRQSLSSGRASVRKLESVTEEDIIHRPGGSTVAEEGRTKLGAVDELLLREETLPVQELGLHEQDIDQFTLQGDMDRSSLRERFPDALGHISERSHRLSSSSDRRGSDTNGRIRGSNDRTHVSSDRRRHGSNDRAHDGYKQDDIPTEEQLTPESGSNAVEHRSSRRRRRPMLSDSSSDSTLTDDMMLVERTITRNRIEEPAPFGTQPPDFARDPQFMTEELHQAEPPGYDLNRRKTYSKGSTRNNANYPAPGLLHSAYETPKSTIGRMWNTKPPTEAQLAAITAAEIRKVKLQMPDDRDCLTEDFFQLFMSENDAKQLCSFVDPAKLGKVTSNMFTKAIVQTYKIRKQIVHSLEAQEEIELVFSRVCEYIMTFVGVLIYLLVVGIDPNTIIVTGVSILTGAGLVLSFVYTDFIQSIILLVFLNPYRIGDRVRIDGEAQYVKRISTYFTEFESLHGRPQYIAHTQLIGKTLINESRCTNASSELNFLFGERTTPSQYAALKKLLEAYVKSRPQEFVTDSLFVYIMGAAPGHYIQISVWVTHTEGWGNWMVVRSSESSLTHYIMRQAQLLGMHYKLPVARWEVNNAPKSAAPQTPISQSHLPISPDL